MKRKFNILIVSKTITMRSTSLEAYSMDGLKKKLPTSWLLNVLKPKCNLKYNPQQDEIAPSILISCSCSKDEMYGEKQKLIASSSFWPSLLQRKKY